MRQNTAVPVVAAKSNPNHITHRAPNLGMEMDEHSARCGSQMEPASHQKWNPKGAKMEPKWSQNGAQMEPKWSPIGSKLGPDTPKFERKQQRNNELKSILPARPFFAKNVANMAATWHP